MSTDQKKFLRFVQSWVINTLAVLVAVSLLPNHITYQRWTDLFIASLLLGILNSFVRPILLFLALPLLIVTLGLFTLVINALLLYLVGRTPFFHVDSYRYAFLGALIVSVVSVALNVMTGVRLSVDRRPPAPPKKDDDDKPVSDV